MPDFSHFVEFGIQLDIRAMSKSERLSDYRVATVVASFDPPLLSPEDMQVVLDELDNKKPRKRGAPIGGKSKQKRVAEKLDLIERSDAPKKFLEALRLRLVSGKRYPVSRKEAEAHRQAMKCNTHSLMRGLYREFKQMDCDAVTLGHPVLGDIDVPEHDPDLTRSERVMDVVADVMRHRLGLPPPARARMFNIISYQP